MRNVLIFHGTGGNPKENWFPYLKKELEKEGCQVFVPQFPHPKDHTLADWLKVLKRYEQYINDDSILVGHSLGGLFLFRVLERLPKSIYAAFLVGAPIGLKTIKYYVSDEKFSGFEFDWKNIKTKAKHFSVYHSDDDPYVSKRNGEGLAKHLGVELTFIPNAGHFNTESGYTKFDQLLEDIKKIL